MGSQVCLQPSAIDGDQAGSVDYGNPARDRNCVGVDDRPSLFDPDMVQSGEFKKWWPQFYVRAYPLGYVPDGVDATAQAQVKNLDLAQQASGLTTPQWISIGPAPINNLDPNNFIFFMGLTNSGQASAIAVRPGHEGEWLVGSSYGGIWKTTDGGSSWRNVSDVLQDASAQQISALTYASADVVYAGSGHGLSPPGFGLLKSTDAGENWAPIASGMFQNERFRSIVTDPSNPQVLLITTKSGLWKSIDGGDTWAQVHQTSGLAIRLEADPTNFAHQYAGA